ncbi:Uncharacterized protein GBIM_18184 [Gryllus bimaculatus]|nr:Uncharacterized protein GBIM_18184 [Gryllus bimaculatus]
MADNEHNVFEKRIQVPWMFLSEWQKVRDDVYSNDIDLQRRSYEKMLLWKARQSRLPAGVECTLELIRVRIIDQEVTQQMANGPSPMYAEHDMQLMCSAAVMRFLNHVSNVAKAVGDTMYSMASKLNIPNWLVLLRHDSAHSTNLPSLEVLRMAVNFALEWLNENYWKDIAIAPELVVSNTEHFSDKRVEEYLDVWQAVKMLLVMQLLHKKIESHTKESDIWKENTGMLKNIIKRVRDKLFQAIKADHSKLEKLLALILESESFIPPVKFLIDGNQEELTNETILHWLCQFWQDFLIPLQEDFGLFPTLVHKLIILLKEEKCKHRQLIMALWINQLCISMAKSQAIMAKASPHNIIELDKDTRMKRADTLKPKIDVPVKVIQKFNKQNVHLKDGFLALINDPKGNSCPVADVKFAVLNPNEFTTLFLSSLLNVANPVIPDTSKCLLKELLSIWMEPTNLHTVKSNKVIHTVEDLYKISGKGVSKKIFFGENIGVTSEPLEYASEYDWATCPLGILPWQKDSCVELVMPSHISWTLFVENVKGSEVLKKTFVHSPYVQEKVNWPAVAKNISLVNAKRKLKKIKAKKLKKAARLHLQKT